tara:strand:+ start:228 stop:1115 length:888 start_codon:yes stop_codon:yes gene_type:complete
MKKADNFQKFELRYKDVLVKKIMNLSFLPSRSDWNEIKLGLTKKAGNAAWKEFKTKYIEYVLFKIFVQKKNKDKYFIQSVIKDNSILEDLANLKSKFELKSGLHAKDVKLSKYPQLNKFCKTAYLTEVRKRYRGVFSVNSHIRLALNDSKENFWDERYSEGKTNFHFDQQFNSFTMIIYLSTVTENDAPFSIIPKSLKTKENIPLALFDRAITDQLGLDSHICSDRSGYYYDFKDDDISRITGSLGSYAMFGGRGILHDGGFPKAGGHRIAIFIDQRNWLMNLINKISIVLGKII